MTEPISLAIFAALLAYFGWRFQFPAKRSIASIGSTKSRSKVKSRASIKQGLTILFTVASIFPTALLLTTSVEISFALSTISTAIPFAIAQQRAIKARRSRERAWPECIDNAISALNSGQSITEALIALAEHGPELLRPNFIAICEQLHAGVNLSRALSEELALLDSPAGEQVFMTLSYAKEYGGRDVTTTLRLLANFLRDEAQIRDEIEARFGWVKNSALMGAIAPWLLLALLSLQKETVAAFATGAGRLVLIVGVVATAGAFIWMERIARLPESPRPFRPDMARSDMARSGMARSDSGRLVDSKGVDLRPADAKGAEPKGVDSKPAGSMDGQSR